MYRGSAAAPFIQPTVEIEAPAPVAAPAETKVNTVVEAAVALDLPLPTQVTLRIGDISYDPQVQRAPIESKLKRITEQFQLAGYGTPALSMREDGTAICLDGQHRSLAAVARGFEDEIVTANAFYGLTLKQEAALFRILNDTTKVNLLDLFRVSLAEGDPTSLAIQAILDRHGLKLAQPNTGRGSTGFNAIKTARRLAALDGGLGALDWALGIWNQAYGNKYSAVDAIILEALTRMKLKPNFGNLIKDERLVTRLAAEPGQKDGLDGQAKSYRHMVRGHAWSSMAFVITTVYSSGPGGGKLPDWK